MDRAREIIATMSLERKVGQLFMLAFPGKDPAKIALLIRRYQIGGCYISQDNAATFEEAIGLTTALQREALRHSARLPLLLGADQEGAWGVLIPASTIGPGNLALGAADDPGITYTLYGIFAEEMGSVGYQAILGPCADVNLDPNNPIIGMRSFGDRPDRVARHVDSAVRGIRDHGGIAVAKHFPGHGDTHIDTHRAIPTVDKSMRQLRANELLPFQAAIDAGVDMIMTSHILFPRIDAERPATLSPKILGDLLRGDMGFKGLIVTDSMNMGAMRRHYSPQEATLLAFEAGADLCMLAEEHYDHAEGYLEKQIASIEGVVVAVRQGDIALSLIEERLSRIIEFKLERLASQQRHPTFGDDDKEQAVKAAAWGAIDIVRDRRRLLPINTAKSVAVVNTTPRSSYRRLINSRGIGPNQQTPAFDTFREEFGGRCPTARFFTYESLQTNLDALAEANADIIVAVTEDYPLPGEDFEKEAQIGLVRALVKRFNDRLVVVGLRSPYEIERFDEATCYITTHSSRTCSAVALAQALLTLSNIDSIIHSDVTKDTL